MPGTSLLRTYINRAKTNPLKEGIGGPLALAFSISPLVVIGYSYGMIAKENEPKIKAAFEDAKQHFAQLDVKKLLKPEDGIKSYLKSFEKEHSYADQVTNDDSSQRRIM